VTRPLPKLAYVPVAAAKLQSATPSYIQLPFQADFIALPAFLPTPAGGYGNNGDADAVWGITINDPSSAELFFSLDKGFQGALQVFEGQVFAIYIRQLSGAATNPLTLLVGTDCDFGCVGAVEGAST
jgi:hypothetical protein